MSLYYRYYLYLQKLPSVTYRPMKAKRSEISILLRSSFKKTETPKQMNVTRMIVHRVKQHLKASEFLKYCPRLGRPLVISQETIKKTFENGPCLKATKLPQNISVSIVSKMIEKWEEKSWDAPENLCWVQQWFKKRLERSTRLLNALKNHGN